MRLRLLALLGVVCFALPAAADPSVGVVVSGDEAVHSTGVTEVETWLSKRNFAIASGALDQDGTLTLSNCLAVADLACARGVVEKRAASDSVVVIIANASGPKKKRDIQLSAYWITKNRDIVSLQRMCNGCTNNVVRETMGALMDDLSKLVPALTGKLQLTSKPPGLVATVDNQAIGVTPLEHDLTPGPHKISIARDGQVVTERTVKITAGETAEITIVAPERPKPKGTTTIIVRKSRAVPVTMIVVGGAAVATGVVFYQIGGPTGNSLYYTDLRSTSYYIAGGGAALALVGAVLFARGGGSSAPTATATNGGAVIGWAGSF